MIPTVTMLDLPSIEVLCCPLLIEPDLPAHGLVRKPVHLKYELLNNQQTPLKMELSMESSEAFMFAGHKQVTCSDLPDQYYLRSVTRMDL